jgi:hypothetical protein
MSTRPGRLQRTPAWIGAGAAVLTLSALGPAALATPSAEELAKLAQNPIANLISVPFQNNTNFDYGQEGGTQNILNIQPVIPITLNKDWNLITRTILPLIWQPELGPRQESTFGLSDTQFSAFLSPSNAKGWIWGVGAIAQLPTHTDRALGNNNWGLGPTAVALHLEEGSPWVYGMLATTGTVRPLGRGQPLGLRHADQQRLVAGYQRRRVLQQRPGPALPQLQLQGRHLPHQRTHRHRQLVRG